MFWHQTLHDPAVFWLALTALLTGVLAAVAWVQLGSLAKSSRSDFLYRLKSDFFTPEARKLVFLIEEGLLHFEDGKIPYFSIPRFEDQELRHRLQELGVASRTVSTHLIDDVILGPLEDVAFYFSEGRITKAQIYAVFSYYIRICARSKAIEAYKIRCRRGAGDGDIYAGVDRLQKLVIRMRTE